MPRIELIPEVLFGSDQPIHWETDNLPLKNLLRRQNLINLALDNVIEEMRDAIGTSGSVANRLNQSMNADGSLKTEAIDDVLHSIEAHEDTDGYVRMTRDQSDKLDLVSDEATNIILHVYTSDTEYVAFDDGIVILVASSTVTPEIEAPNRIKLNLNFPADAVHQHFYGLEPVHVNLSDPNYINYKVNSPATPFVEGSLRVYINGIRIFADAEVYAPGALVSDAWTLISFTEDFENGLFELSTAIAEEDIIRIDFDRLFV